MGRTKEPIKDPIVRKEPSWSKGMAKSENQQ